MAELKKVLSFPAILLITINSILGTGIFFLPAVGAKASGPASLLAWLVMSLISIYIAMCFAELSSMFPKSGGIYEFCKQAYGRFFSFLIGWSGIIVGNITIAMLIVGAIHYLMPFPAPLLKIGICLAFIFIFNFVAYRGMQTSAFMLITFAFITLGTIFLLTLPALFKFQISNLLPFWVVPLPSVALTVFLIAETFFGWETATFLAEETKDGEKIMPKALIWGTVILVAFAFIFVFSSLGAMNWREFSQAEAPLSDLSKLFYGGGGSQVFTILVYLAIIGSVAGWIVSAPRLLLALARDRLFPSQLASIHHQYHTPYKAIIFQTILTSVLVIVGTGSYLTLLHLLLPMAILLYVAVLLSLVVLRFKKPHLTRFYKVPLGRIGPLLVSLILVSLILIWLKKTPGAWGILKLGASFVFLGIPVYFLMQLYYNPKVITKSEEWTAYLTLFSEKFFFSPIVKEKIIELAGDLKKKKVWEVGCSVGTLTEELAKEVTKKGKIFATDLAWHNVKITQKRMEKKGHSHVKVIHHPRMDKKHPLIPKVGVVISAGLVSSVPQVLEFLRQVNRTLSSGGRIIFMDYEKFFYFIPNVPWLSNDQKIKSFFQKAGFEIEIKREKGIFFRKVFIYGKKVKEA